MICLHNSSPIDPPPPVTRTTLPLIKLLMLLLSSSIGSLPSKSSISTSLKLWKRFSSVISSLKSGRTFTWAFVLLHSVRISFLSLVSMLTIEKNISSTSYFSQILMMSFLFPIILTPATEYPIRFLLSSMIPTISYSPFNVEFIVLIMSLAEYPPPINNSFFWFSGV